MYHIKQTKYRNYYNNLFFKYLLDSINIFSKHIACHERMLHHESVSELIKNVNKCPYK